MAIALEPAPLPPSAGEYPLDADCFDEGIAPTGTPRHPFAAVLDALARHDLALLGGRVQSDAEKIGLTFGPGRPIAVDPVPRLVEAVEWEALEAGLAQRARALNAFLADAYGEQRIFAEGIVPRRLLETSAGYEPLMRGLLDLELPPATVAGLDLVRNARGELMVLEDNLRMPSGSAYAGAVREVVESALGASLRPRPPDSARASPGTRPRGTSPARWRALGGAALGRPAGRRLVRAHEGRGRARHTDRRARAARDLAWVPFHPGGRRAQRARESSTGGSTTIG